MKLKKAAIAATMLGVTLLTPAVAQAGLSQCTGTNMCVWGNNDFNWLIAAQNHGQGVIDPFNDANGENNQNDSWANRSSTYSGCLYDGQGSGGFLTMSKVSNNNNVSFTDSDKASSMKTNGGC